MRISQRNAGAGGHHSAENAKSLSKRAWLATATSAAAGNGRESGSKWNNGFPAAVRSKRRTFGGRRRQESRCGG